MMQDQLQLDARRYLPDGQLLARGRILRSGPYPYRSGELQLDGPERSVQVERTGASVAHVDTLRSLRGAPITLEHPGQGEVNAGNYRQATVGYLVGEPWTEDAGDGQTYVYSDLRVWDPAAVQAIDDGQRQISIGYDFQLEGDERAGYRTTGPIQINHAALVTRGRAGSHIEVLDQEQSMPEETTRSVAEQVQDALDGLRLSERNQTEILARLGPVYTELGELRAQRDQAQASVSAQDADRAAAEAQAAADEFEQRIRSEERQRFTVLTDALPHISAEDRAQAQQADLKDILVLALKDRLPNAAECSVEFLQGYLAGLPAPQATAPSMTTVGSMGDSQAGSARDEYIKRLTGAAQPQGGGW